MAMKASTLNVIKYLQEHNTENLTSRDVAAALDLDVKVVDGAFTAGVQRKQMGYRLEAEVEVADAEGNITHETVKFLKLTQAGLDFKAPTEETAE